jgi:S-layer homology domain/Glucodextranase, domain B
VRWTGKDNPKGSGIASYDIQYRIIPQGAWTDWKLATSETQATFEGLDGYTYGFRSRARDAAGNVEVYRDEPDAYTSVDTQPPPLRVDAPQKGAHVNPGPVLVRGHTEPGIFVAVNDKRAEEANGVFTATVQASGRDFVIGVTAADPAGNVARLEITVQAAPRYNDVPMDHPAFTAIEYLSDQGVVSGYGDGSFRPNAPVTRAQLAKTLAIAMRWGLIKPIEPRFSDVDPGSWQYPYVETAVARKVMSGFSDGTFQPNAPVSREEAVHSLVLAARWKTGQSSTSHYVDGTSTEVLSPFMEAAYRHGIIAPDDDGSFHPRAPATRAVISTMVYHLLIDMIQENPPGTQDDQGDQGP